MSEANSAVSHIVASLIVHEIADMMSSDRLPVVAHHQANTIQFFLGTGAACCPHIMVVLFTQGQRRTQIGSLLLRNHDISSHKRRS